MTDPLTCRECHRRLKRPSPTGYGPVCERRINGRRRTPAITAPSSEQIPGQTELPLVYREVTLWSL